MPKLNQQGIAHILVLILLLAGIGAGVYLVQKQTNLKPKAQTADINIVDDSGIPITETSSLTVKVKASDPWPNASGSPYSASASGKPTNAISDSSNSGNGIWENVTGVLDSDDQYASIKLGRRTKSQYLRVFFNMGHIPQNAQIQGIEVNIEKRSSRKQAILDGEIKLMKNNKILPANKAQPKTKYWQTKDTIDTYGGISDLWGDNTWVPIDFASSGFGVLIAPKMVRAGEASVFVDSVMLKIYYFVPSTPPSVLTKSLVLAEDPRFSVNVQSQDFTTNLISYTFSHTSPGLKTLYGKFIGTDGREQTAANNPALVTYTPPSPSPSVTPLPTATSSAEPTITPIPTPSPSPVVYYMAPQPSSSISLKNSSSATLFALLKSSGYVVTDQSDIEYVWEIKYPSSNPAIISLVPFNQCERGIQPPCPNDHATVSASSTGSAYVYASAIKKSSKQLLVKDLFYINVIP